MVRDNSNDFYSNPESTPIEVFQHNSFRDGYFKASFTFNRGRQEWKVGVESDSTFLHENTSYNITDPSQFEAGTPLTFAFQGERPDLEQAVFVQDLIHLKQWTISAGLRWDHYQLLLNKQAAQPRFSIARHSDSLNTTIHFSYDRVFQTPSIENLLLSSSDAVTAISPNFLRLPVKPSQGDYYEIGLSSVFAKHLRLNANYFRRSFGDYADDDQIDNTSISFPISFRKAIISGAEGKVEVPEWHRFSGFASYSYEVGNVWNPVTGGLFLGQNASVAASLLSGHFPDSQDQRNTVRGRVRYQATSRIWFAGGVQYDSGLPFQFGGSATDALAQYGPQIINRINFDRGRILPCFQVNASAGTELYRGKRVKMRLQADGQNLTNVLDVIDFGGLFSGNAIGPPRSFSLRLTGSF
jgi:outer membrane receptor for Fe3+-dicitrate